MNQEKQSPNAKFVRFFFGHCTDMQEAHFVAFLLTAIIASVVVFGWTFVLSGLVAQFILGMNTLKSLLLTSVVSGYAAVLVTLAGTIPFSSMVAQYAFLPVVKDDLRAIILHNNFGTAPGERLI